MAFSTAQAEEWHWLVQIDVDDSTTRYYADTDLSMSDGNFYEGLLSDDQEVLSQEFGSITEPREVFADFEIAFVDPDGSLYLTIKEEGWGICPVRVYLGQIRTFADYDLFVSGIVEFPGMLRRQIPYTTIRVQDDRRSWNAEIPPKTYFTAWADAPVLGYNSGSPINMAYIRLTCGTNGADYDNFRVGDVIQVGDSDNGGDGYLVTDVLPASNKINVSPNITALNSDGTPVVHLVFPDMEEHKVGTRIPVLYGDWSESAGGGEMVPVTCIDPDTPKFHIAEHPLPSGSLTKCTLYNSDNPMGVDVTADLTGIDYDRTTFEFNSYAYNEATDKVYVNVQGRTDDGTKTGTLLTALPDIWQDLFLTYGQDVESGDIDSTAFSAFQAAVATLARLHITDLQTVDDISAILMYDGFSDLSIRDAKLYPVHRSIAVDEGATAFDKEDLVDDGADDNPKPRYSVDTNPEIYLNRANFFYRWNPEFGRYDGRDVTDNGAAQDYLGAVRSRDLELLSIYVADDAGDRAQEELNAFSQDIEEIVLTLTQRAVQVELGERIFWTYDIYDLATIHVRGMRTDLPGVTNEVLCWKITGIDVGYWTAADAATYAAATETELTTQGFWGSYDESNWL